LTYGASSRFNALKNGGSFAISTFTAEKTTEPAIDKALKSLISCIKMVSMKNHWLLLKLCQRTVSPRYETTEQQANLLTQMFWYDFDKSFINNFEKMLMTDLAK
jgi:predicted Zn-dependent peptidase